MVISATTDLSAPARAGASWPLPAAFAANGLLVGTWISRLPAVSDGLHASTAAFGAALTGGAVGAIVSLMVASRACRRFGARPVYTVSVAAWGLLYVAAAHSPNAAALFAVLFFAGLVNGVWNVVVNAAGHAQELQTGRPLLPRLHGLWSVGSLAGSILGARVAGHVSASLHVSIAALVAGALAVVASRLVPVDGVVTGRAVARVARRSWRTTRDGLRGPAAVAVLGAGVIALCSTIAEGAANNWAALFLHRDRGMSEGAAAACFAVFAGAMAVARLGGNRVAASLRRETLLRIEAVLLGGGALLLVLVPGAVAAAVALAAWGAGIAVVYPTAMGIAAGAHREPTVGISQASAVAVAGFVVGPPLIGALASVAGLGAALLLVPVAGIGLWLLAPLAATGEPARDEVGADGPITGEIALVAG